MKKSRPSGKGRQHKPTSSPPAIDTALQHHQAGRLAEAAALYRQILQAQPDHTDALHLLGALVQQQGQYGIAVELIGKAIALQPSAQMHYNLGVALQALNNLDAAIVHYRQAIALKPDYAVAYCNLGTALQAQEHLDAAVESYRQAIARNTDDLDAHNNLGSALQTQGKHAAAVEVLRHALALKPNPLVHSNLIFTLDLMASVPTAVLQEERQRWDALHAAPLATAQQAHANTAEPQRPLRIAYVSADFRAHSAAAVFGTMLVHFDRSQFEVFAYSNTKQEDATTDLFRRSVTVWRNIVSLSDDAVAKLIRADGIDILVDLSGHSAGNRLLVFARKPAPVQITAWGYATSTGLKAIDAFFADAIVVPPEEKSLFTEEVRTLPSVVPFFSVQSFPPLAPLPALSAGHITFGSFNRLAKISEPSFDLWAQVLLAVPTSRLLLKTVELNDDAERTRVLAYFTRAGVAPERITLLGRTTWEQHVAAFNQVDIALDPFPHGGGVTTLEGLMMGVPVVTLRWNTIVGRLSASMLTTLGLTDWIAETPQHYLDIAVQKARELTALQTLRMSLRERLSSSVIGNHAAYVTAVEQEYRTLWQRWCTTSSDIPTLAQALEHHQAGRLPQAEAMYLKILQQQPEHNDHAQALHLLGALAQQQGDHARAVELIGQAIQLQPSAQMYYNRGVALQRLDHLDAASADYRQAITLKPDYAEACSNLGTVLQLQGNADAAAEQYRQAIALKPDDAAAHVNLGKILQAQNLPDAAIAHYRRAITLRPGDAETCNELGRVLQAQGALDAAISHYQQAIAIKPECASVHNNLGTALQAQDKIEAAIACYQTALQIEPDNVDITNNLGKSLQTQGNIGAAVETFRQALALKPDPVAHSTLIFSLDLMASMSTAALQEERQRWDALHAAPLITAQQAPANPADAQRCLRIGYVSADFYGHSAAFIFGAMLVHFDRTQFEVFAYSNTKQEDATTDLFRRSVTVWRNIVSLSDDAVAELIRADGIDILVDLSGHSAGNRLLVFARKPAPVQITAWGYATSTGLKAIDAFFADAVVVPPEEKSLFTEEVRMLPSVVGYFNMWPFPAVNPLPALSADGITFGSFNRLTKISEPAFDLWAQLLLAVPNSQLLLKTAELSDAETCARIASYFTRAGVAAERIRMLGRTSWEEHVTAFHQVDIALDPFPHGGGVTTLEGLMMGVPVVTLRWNTIVGRLSASMLTTLGLTDWIAESPQHYLDIALQKARDLSALQTLRRSLRERLSSSVIGNHAAYVTAVEQEYRTLWQRWCTTSSDIPTLAQALEHHQAGRLPQAEAMYLKILQQQPEHNDHAQALHLLGALAQQQGDHARAVELIGQAIQLQPSAQMYYNRGVALQRLDRLDAAIENYRQAIALQPGLAKAHSNLAAALQSQGQLEEAIACHRRSLQINPSDHAVHSNLIFAMDMSACFDTPILQQERRHWDAVHAAPLAALQRVPDNTPDAERPLRIGYVSADFKGHSATSVFGAMLLHFDSSRFEVFAYSNTSNEDSYTQLFAQRVNCWRNIVDQSDDAAAELIRADGIDILVDLSGHSAGNRLLVFARKPAPIQITAWGYATSTGLQAMDAFFADPVVVPPQEQALLTEEVRMLPSVVSYFHAQPYPPVNDLPALTNNAITFGSFNRLTKTSPQVFSVWARLLAAIPHSRLLLKTPELSDADTCARIAEYFTTAGIARERITLLGRTLWEQHVAAFNQVDIALDPFPHGGGVTTLEGLMMGVPVITLRWPTIVGRLSASMLTTLGLTDWIAETEQQYLDLALQKARDLSALATLRSTLRERLSTSVIGNHTAYVAAVEQEYRTLWQRWCRTRKNTSASVPTLAAALTLHQTGHLPQAEAMYREILQQQPNHAQALHLLGALAQQQGDSARAAALIGQAIQLQPSAQMYYNRGVAWQTLEQLDAAVQDYQQAIALQPDFIKAHSNLGTALQTQAKFEQAIACHQRVLDIQPDYVEAYNNLGEALQSQGRLDAAIEAYRHALSLCPDFPEVHNNLGNALMAQKDFDNALKHYNTALVLRPDFYKAHNNLGTAWQSQGKLDQAIACFRQVLEIKPDDADAHCNLIFTLDMAAHPDTLALQEERRRWDAQHAAPLAALQRAHGNRAEPLRRLRIGYVSADFRTHSAASVFGAMLVHFDRTQFDVFAYSNTRNEDATTALFRQHVDRWHNIVGRSDEAVADLIRQDSIDILVDLSGHSAGNRLLVFARKPAPIQITAWGYATSTGLRAMDVFFADPVVVPPQEKPLFTEEVRYLPSVVSSFNAKTFPPANALPALSAGRITFGSFNRLTKISQQTFDVWAQILLTVPNSRLLLKTGELSDASTCARIAAHFTTAGIAHERIVMQGHTSWEAHMAAFHQVDIALDPFPHGGGVTTLEGLMMGVPVITLRWPTIVGRLSASILTTLEMPDWIAETPQQYLDIAVTSARNLAALKHVRGALRERLSASVIGNPIAYVAAVEQEYRALWQRWCNAATTTPPSFAEALEHHQAGRLPQAEAIYRAILQHQPDHVDALHLLGALAQQCGDNTRAVALIGQALAAQPTAPMYYNRGVALQALGQFDAAVADYRQAVALNPNYAGAYCNLGTALQLQDHLDAAIEQYRHAITLKPDYVEAWNNLGLALYAQGNYQAAVESYRQALPLRPGFSDLHGNLGSALQTQGKTDAAIESFRRALALKPDHATHSNLIFTLDMAASVTTAVLQQERQRWHTAYAAPLAVLQSVHHNHPEPQRRLRIGYVSADYRTHSAAFVFGAMLVHFDRNNFEVFAYSNTRKEDPTTDLFRQQVSCWRNIIDLSDDAVAELIRRDGIDILVDLSGHSAGNRLLVFARKPAPIQITAWGYATSTGLRAMDVFFADPVVVPPAERTLFTETIRDLPNVVNYFSPRPFPPVNPLPALAAQEITFGSFNRLAKISESTFSTWAQVLLTVPHSRLVLKTAELDDIQERQRIHTYFTAAGVAPERITLSGKTSWEEHLAAFGQIDIALDPFPHGGGVTTLEGLMMGVPVITLRWHTIVGRLSASILTTLGMTDWIAETPQQMVEIVVRKAGDLAALQDLRAGLRARMMTSVIGDCAAYVAAVEREYRGLWGAWCVRR